MPYGGEPWEADQEVVAHGGEPWESDQELVAHILRGSIEHCDMLYEAYFPWVHRFALKRLQDPAQAEDATREAFSIVFDALRGFKGRPSLRVGISRITRDTVNRRLAARKCEEPWKDDADLVTKILRGSTDHFDMLFEAHFPRVYRFALKRLRDPVEAADVTQEVFFRVFSTLRLGRWRIRAGTVLTGFLKAAKTLSPILGPLIPDAAMEQLRGFALNLRWLFPSSLLEFVFHITRKAVYERLGRRTRPRPPKGGKPLGTWLCWQYA